METPNPFVSIIIPAQNEGDNVRRTVESLLTNTDSPEFEIIMIDDGCTDTSFAFLESDSYRSSRRLRRYRFNQSVGLIRARHQGVRLARGKCILFLDAHIAVVPGWLTTLVKAIERWGPHSTITPTIATLNEVMWAPNPPTGQILTIDEKFNFVWESLRSFTGMVPMAGGCGIFMHRRFYYQIGGVDLGLRRWGCENIDLILKVYAAGGTCYLEPSVVIGHLFRSNFPYPMSFHDLTYNKLRVGYVHLSDRSFRLLLDRLTSEPGYAEAMADFRADVSELDHLRRAQRGANRRDADWFVRMFLPGLCDKPGTHDCTE
jgi:glycosyltransferase involved in cell wall biosynthesis